MCVYTNKISGAQLEFDLNISLNEMYLHTEFIQNIGTQ